MLRNYSYDCFKKISNSHELNYSKNKIKFNDSMRNEEGIKPLFVLDINLNDNQKKEFVFIKEKMLKKLLKNLLMKIMLMENILNLLKI